jgi:hypothetical protein
LTGLIPILVFLLYRIIFGSRRQRRKEGQAARQAAAAWPGLDSEFYLLEKKLLARGLPRQQGELLSEWLQRAVKDQALTGLSEPLNALLRLHYRYRFDPRGLDREEREVLKREVASCLARVPG